MTNGSSDTAMPESAAAFARGAFGDLVAVLQKGLARLGHYTGRIDSDFGGGTDNAVRSLQIDRELPETGRADPITWGAATGMPWPELFERCLQLTARFEGHGYRRIAGNFDGAGLTWGIIGFTLRHGEIQAIVNEVAMRAPQLLDAAFADHAGELVERLHGSADELMSWADSVSTGARKQLVKQPWRDGFAALGGEPFVQEIQRRRARVKYFDKALATAARFGLEGDRGVALCFDIHVQNGGVKSADAVTYEEILRGPDAPETSVARRELLARIVADSARRKYRADVLARKSAIATGQGVVHGQLFQLDDWALAAS